MQRLSRLNQRKSKNCQQGHQHYIELIVWILKVTFQFLSLNTFAKIKWKICFHNVSMDYWVQIHVSWISLNLQHNKVHNWMCLNTFWSSCTYRWVPIVSDTTQHVCSNRQRQLPSIFNFNSRFCSLICSLPVLLFSFLFLAVSYAFTHALFVKEQLDAGDSCFSVSLSAPFLLTDPRWPASLGSQAQISAPSLSSQLPGVLSPERSYLRNKRQWIWIKCTNEDDTKSL